MARTTTRTRSTRRVRRAPPAKTARRTRSKPRVPQGNRGPIERLLREFSQALTAGDGTAAAQKFEYPALMVMEGNNQLLTDEQQVAQFFGEAPKQYQAKGIYEARADIEDVDWLTPNLAIVRTHWPYMDKEGRDMKDGETSLYVVRTTGNDAAICSAITLGVDSERNQR